MDPADPSSWIITSTAIGPGRLAASAEEFNASVAPAFTIRDRCEDLITYNPVRTDSGLGMWSEDGGSGMGNAAIFAEAVPAAPLAKSPRTENGIALGSSLADLKAAYPHVESWADPRADTSTPQGTWFVVHDGANAMLFGVTDDRVKTIQITTALPPAGFCS